MNLGLFKVSTSSRKNISRRFFAWEQFFSSACGSRDDPAYKQIIPYALIAFQNKVVYYVRGKKAGEQRLVAKGSIGIGGHMNETDESLFAMDEQAYRAGVEREVNEEIKIDAPFEDRIVALLNDDTTEVGRVHLGIVHVFKLAEPKVEKREAMITGLTFLRERRIVCTSRNHGDMVADLSGFARPFVAVAAPCLPRRSLGEGGWEAHG